MRRTFTDDQFDEWEVYISGGQPGGRRAAQIMFVCQSSPTQVPRRVVHPSGDPAEAEKELAVMSDSEVLELFQRSEPVR